MMTIRLKKSIRSIFIGLIAMTALPVMAASDSSSSGNGDAVLTTKEEDTFRKRMPSRMILLLTYADGNVSISSDFYEGEFSLSFENIESGETTEVPSIQVGRSVPLELNYGEYQLTAVGEDGTVLCGYMQVY